MFISAFAACVGAARADTCGCGSSGHNPFFGPYRHQAGLYGGAGVNSGIIVPMFEKFVPFTEIHGHYSVPSEVFYYPARLSLNLSQTIGFGNKYGWEWTHFTIPIIYVTMDIAMFYGRNWYFGMGGGGGFQITENERISSKLVFQFKIFSGIKITNRTGLELYVKHFSNGNTTPANHSYAFYGLGMTYSF